MYITVTLKINDSKYNIKIDNRQNIYIALNVLKQRELVNIDSCPLFYKSHQKEEVVSAYNTFKNLKIYSGDILEAIIT